MVVFFTAAFFLATFFLVAAFLGAAAFFAAFFLATFFVATFFVAPAFFLATVVSSNKPNMMIVATPIVRSSRLKGSNPTTETKRPSPQTFDLVV